MDAPRGTTALGFLPADFTFGSFKVIGVLLPRQTSIASLRSIGGWS
jgi:hypothetical protein